jgi:hypothetical protein
MTKARDAKAKVRKKVKKVDEGTVQVVSQVGTEGSICG